MDLKKLKTRNSSLDIIRIVAVFSVVSVHFFRHAKFYDETITGYGPIEGIIHYLSSHHIQDLNGPIMYIMVMMRTLFGVCVPLFLILTGWLMSKKTISRKYYTGIRKTLLIFLLDSILCLTFKSIYTVDAAKTAFLAGDFGGMHEAIKAAGGYGIKDYIFGIFNYKAANYSWYIEMYIGLFLIAPFLNLAYNKLKTKRQKQVLLATFLFLTVAPSIFNIFNFDTATWWVNPTESDKYQKIIPTFWTGIYPITYYFTGMYLREFGLKLRTRSVAALFASSLFLFTVFNIFRSYGTTFQTGSYGDWGGFCPYILAVLLFVMLSRIKSDTWNLKSKNVLMKISDLALGAYLTSFISDTLIYEWLRTAVPVFTNRLPYFFLVVPLSLTCAMGMSFILNVLANLIIKAYEKIKAFVIAQRVKDDRQKWQNYLFYALMLIGVIFALWKCRYGFGGNDEAFYLSIPHRLIKGDALFVDEWSVSQMSGVLLLPFTWFCTVVRGTTEGIILAARVVYVFVHAAATFIIYSKLKKYGYLSVFGCFLYFIFTPYDIMALSSNTMGLELVILTGVLIGTADYHKKRQIIFSGITFAGVVLCCPYLAFVYVLYALCMCVHLVIRKKEIVFALKSKMFALRTFLFFSAGFGALAAVFILFALTRASVGEIFENLPYILKDPAHPNTPVFETILKYFETIYISHNLFKFLLYAYGGTLLAMAVDKKRRLHRSIYLIISVGLSVCALILCLPELHKTTFNAVMFPMIFVSITSYILCKHKPRELFTGLFCLGVLYSICIFFTSNRDSNTISMALTASNLAGYIFLSQLIREMREAPDNITYAVWIKRFSFVFIAFLIILQGSFQISIKAHHTFWDYDTSELKAQITSGPAKGIYTNDNKIKTYNEACNDLEVYRDKEKDNILFLTQRNYTYLAVDGFSYGTYSANLLNEDNKTLQRLKDYYSLHPDKIPKYIYIPKDSKWNDIDSILEEAKQNGYDLKTTNVSYQLEKSK